MTVKTVKTTENRTEDLIDSVWSMQKQLNLETHENCFSYNDDKQTVVVHYSLDSTDSGVNKYKAR